MTTDHAVPIQGQRGPPTTCRLCDFTSVLSAKVFKGMRKWETMKHKTEPTGSLDEGPFKLHWFGV